MSREWMKLDGGRRFHVLIVGGGIGGLSLAQGLRKAGVSFQVFERDSGPDERLQGYRLNIEPLGARALHECLPEKLWSLLIATAGSAGRGMGVFDETLSLLMREDDPPPPKSPAEATHAISRGLLRGILLSGLEGHIAFGKQFTRFEILDDRRVLATFADGTTASGDVLVGADGINSRVRPQLLPQARLVPAGGVGIGGKLYLTPEVERWLPEGLQTGKNMVLPRKDFLFTAIFKRRGAQEAEGQLFSPDSTQNDYLMWAYVAAKDGNLATAEDLDSDALRVRVLDRMSGWSPNLRRLVAEADRDSIGVFDFRTALPVRPWPSTAVTLLGDSIHAMPPVGGLGGNAALADANALCDALVAISAGRVSLSEALRAYEGQMLRRGFGLVAQARRYLWLAVFPSRLVRATARGFFRTCGKLPVLRRAVFGDG